MENETCVICGKEIVWDGNQPHWFHDDNCPNHSLEIAMIESDGYDCKCHNPCHVECCPICNYKGDQNEQ